MQKKEFINYANSFQSIAKLRLESITELMENLGNPQDDLKFIHVAGTNGKGSVCCFLQNILTDAGYITGKYISPNMIRVNERISVNGEEISDTELDEIMSRVMKEAENVKDKLGELPTQFEIWTACAFCYYKQKKCDYVVLETGLGGTRDATNIIKNPVITVITRIASDHIEYLGNTLAEIANEKAGIIKSSIFGGCTVTVNQEPEVYEVLKDTANKHNNEFIIIKNQNVHEYNGQLEVFDYSDIKNIKMSMIGMHQCENAALAIECAKKIGIDEKYIRSGILKGKNPGRFDLISGKPMILFDGAHNKNGMQSLSENLVRCFSDKHKCFIMGFMKDKDIDGALLTLKNNGFDKNTTVYTVKVKDNQRAISAEELAGKLQYHGFSAKSTSDIKNALELAKSENKMIVICGSLYLYKDLYEIL